MRRFSIKTCSFVLLSLLVMFIISCDNEIKIHSSVMGEAIATPSTAKNGDKINLSIGGNISASGTSAVNGKEYYPTIHYLIDGNEVAISPEKAIPFNAEYQITNLSIGEHILSVNITSSSEDATYDNQVTPSTIIVTE